MIIMKNPDWSEEQHISFAQKVADNEGTVRVCFSRQTKLVVCAKSLEIWSNMAKKGLATAADSFPSTKRRTNIVFNRSRI